MAARRSRKCCTRTSTRAPTKCASIRATRAPSTPRCGNSNRRSGRRRRSDPIPRRPAPAGSTGPPTVGRPGHSSATVCRRCSKPTSRPRPATPRAGTRGGGSGPVSFYKSSDGGAHWTLRTRIPGAKVVGDTAAATADDRPLGRIGGGDLPPIVVDPQNENVVYSASIVMWRTEDGGTSWPAVRGSPGGDDYQRIWIDPNDANLILAVSDQGA